MPIFLVFSDKTPCMYFNHEGCEAVTNCVTLSSLLLMFRFLLLLAHLSNWMLSENRRQGRSGDNDASSVQSRRARACAAPLDWH